MPLELTVLALCLLWHGAQYLLVAIPANLELGTKITLAPRDDGPLSDKVRPRTARLARALDNHSAALTLFAPATILVVWAERTGPATGALALVYLGARILYVPAYAFDWQPWRSVFWMIGFFATMALAVAAIL